MFYDAITDFIFVEDEPEKADIIFIPGSICPELAIHAAKLYHEGYAPYIMSSGKYSILKGHLELPESGKTIPPADRQAVSGNSFLNTESMDCIADCSTECDYLCRILKAEGIPEQAILREPEATFTWENAIYSRRITDAAHLSIRKAILCCKAYHARRSLMYYQQQFPDTRFMVCPVTVDGISRSEWHRTRNGIDKVLGEVERCGTQFHEILADMLPS
ncbi:MAG: YdcF family protein [Lachnospiraceae bacterium]|nr:YdcF family protein [Lachnospiraceae bacterium]